MHNLFEDFTLGKHMGDMWMDIIQQEKYLQKFAQRDGKFQNSVPEFQPGQIPKLIDGFNEFVMTAHVAGYVRQFTTARAILQLIDFVTANKDALVVPKQVEAARVNGSALITDPKQEVLLLPLCCCCVHLSLR